MLVGIYLGQFCITTLTWFFLTWFPIYLGRARHLSIVKVGFLAALPALCGFAGGILGGGVSDELLRSGHSLSFARKLPIDAAAMRFLIPNWRFDPKTPCLVAGPGRGREASKGAAS
jgi:MFS transporter, ACS family, glucarate transporter